jgi:N-acetylglutamate synthase-like GNAT family acetyltransferase
MEIKILPQKDIKEFWKLQTEYLDKWTLDHLKTEYSKFPDLYVGCYEEGKLIGIAHGFIKGDIIILQGIAVKYDTWRKGIGTKILNFFEKQAKQTGKKIISVGSAEGFVEKFYLKNGYNPVEIQAKGEDHHIFAKEKVKDYDDGLKKKDKLRKKLNPKEVIFIMEKRI